MQRHFKALSDSAGAVEDTRATADSFTGDVLSSEAYLPWTGSAIGASPKAKRYCAVGMANSGPLGALSGQRCITDF
jgi:hypothetical protein